MNRWFVSCGLALLLLTSSMGLKAAFLPVPPPTPGAAFLPVPPPTPGAAFLPVPPPTPGAAFLPVPPPTPGLK